MELCATYQNTHHQLTVVIGSQQGETCRPFRFKLMSNVFGNINTILKSIRKIAKHIYNLLSCHYVHVVLQYSYLQ